MTQSEGSYLLQRYLCETETSHKTLPNLPYHPNGVHVPRDDLSPSSSLQIAKDWLETCVSQHHLCGYNKAKSMPTRILDVGTSTIRLVAGVGMVEQYVCLSHCWGMEPMLETTLDNIDEFQQSIPWEALPATFRDAIEVTRGLGLRYIWIDSLCIIQRDTSIPSDWQKESAKMASVYKGSYVTIAAATSKDSTCHCFEGPTRLEFKPRELEATQKLGDRPCSVYARFALPHAPNVFDRWRFPLLGRAWVFQERLLSPRVIYLGCYELQWECRSEYQCECGAASDDSLHGLVRNPKTCFADGIDGPTSTQYLSAHDPQHKLNCNYCSEKQNNIRGATGPTGISPLYTQNFYTNSEYSPSPYNTRVAWRELLRNYVLLKVTYTSDIFPALSGLAHAWRDRHGSEYLAGLWESSLIHDLTWYTSNTGTRSAEWRAPTWSWASLDDAFYEHDSLFQFMHQKDFIAQGTRVEAVEVVPDGPDWAGQLRHAQISITCRAIPGRLDRNLSTHVDPPDSGFFRPRSYWLSFRHVVYHSRVTYFDRIVWDAESPDFIGTSATIYLLPLGVTAFDTSPIYSETEDTAPISDEPVKCMLVIRTGGSDEFPTYERLGCTHLAPQDVASQTLVPLKDRIPEDDPVQWPQVEFPDERVQKRKLGLRSIEPWQYDAHCEVTKAIREAPLQKFTIV
jgi:hypothetical protein